MSAELHDPFDARAELETAAGKVTYYRLQKLVEDGIASSAPLPYSIKVLLEAALRQCDGFEITKGDVERLARWEPQVEQRQEMPFKPGRVVLQDFTGVPSVVDLAACRSALARIGGDPSKVNPEVPVDLVIDHSVQVDRFGSRFALMYNAELEFSRNRERYEFLRWGQKAFDNFRVVPPATGIVHQVNLEFLASAVLRKEAGGATVAYPDSLVGTDSHTTMINGLGVVGWGVGGIEAEAVMLGQPIYMLTPDVIGFRLEGRLPAGGTATDLVLVVTEMLRKKGVVGKFVEFYGPGLNALTLADRATIANMSPEYGATMGFFPIDSETLNYMRSTGRSAELCDLVERYTKAQGLFREDDAPDPVYTDTITLDMANVRPSLAGPKLPHTRIGLNGARLGMKGSFLWDVTRTFEREVTVPAEHEAFAAETLAEQAKLRDGADAAEADGAKLERRRDLFRGQRVEIDLNGEEVKLTHGSVLIAAITSCTNTSNPSVMVGAGILAKNAVERGLATKPWVKTSLAPGSRVVTGYLDKAGLTPYLDALRFHTVGYGCTTCIGNSGPLHPTIAETVKANKLITSAVLSGNRNFEGRVSQITRANYLASPPLVVAYALAGTVDIDFATEPVGCDPNGAPVYLTDLWPSAEEIRETIAATVNAELFAERYGNVFDGNETWNQIRVPEGALFPWDPKSTYIQEPPFFQNMTTDVPASAGIEGARCLALLGDAVTTDHISPAGAIAPESPAALYLEKNGVERTDWNSYGSRRGNHEVMMRGTFANIRIRNELVPEVEGGVTLHIPSGEQMTIWDAAERYTQEGTQLVVVAGKLYGSGSSRDWAAKGPQLQNVRAVIAESYERIHRSNLVGMGVMPLQFAEGESRHTLELTGHELYTIEGLTGELTPGQTIQVVAKSDDGEKRFDTVCRIDTPVEVNYYRNGGILHTVLRRLGSS